MAKRKWDTGLVRPYRLKPDDFRQTYIEMGWDGICDHYRTNWRVIRRWIDEEGREGLKRERAQFLVNNGVNFLHTGTRTLYGNKDQRAKSAARQSMTAVKTTGPEKA